MTDPFENLSARLLFESASDAMLLVDHDGHIAAANPSALELLEYRKEELIDREVETLIPCKFNHHQHQQYRKAFYSKPVKRSMGNGRNLYAKTRSNKLIPVDVGLGPIEAKGKVYILTTFYPAENRHETERALRNSEERLKLAKQAAKLGVFDFNPIDKSFHCDDYMYTLFGIGSVLPTTYEQLFIHIHPDDITSRNLALEQASDPLGNGEYKTEYRIKISNSGTERWLKIIGQMYFEDGKPSRLVGVVQDITEHKLFEEFHQKHREETESISNQQIAIHTASAIAHELNQPLSAISTYSDVALHALNKTSFDTTKLKRALEGCVSQAQRAGNSLHELLAILQRGELVTEGFDLNSIVLEAISITKSDGYKEFKPVTNLEKNIPYVIANRTQVLKVMVNLLRNAVEAMRGAGVPDTSIAITTHTNKELNMGHVMVQDSGPGISQEMVNRIFQPFFTTKPTGIGMGLAISRTLIEANGGQLWLDPSAKPGATFHFTLPFAS